MENTVRKKEVPMFSVGDFKDFSALILKLKNNANSPLYSGLSLQNQEFVNNFTAELQIDKKIKKLFCEDFNNLLRKYDLYKNLLAYYGKNHFEAKLSQDTKDYCNSLDFLTKPQEKLISRERTKIEWLNMHLITDLHVNELYKIRRKGFWHSWGESLLVAAALVVFVRAFFFQIYKIPTTSMVPTLMPGDKIFVSKLTYGPKVPFSRLRLPGFRKPERGEVVVFVPPHERNKSYIKRLIGLPGDRILIKDGNLYINGKKSVDPRLARNYYYNQGQYGMENKEVVVPKGKFLFLGDNSIQSLDGRFWGFVDKTDVVGKAIFIWWPPQRVSMVE
jgi:signal peptidase I